MPAIQPLVDRLARYERIVILREQGMTYEQIGVVLDPPLTKERVRRIVISGRPKRAGRPSRPGRAEALRAQLADWESRRTRLAWEGRPTARAEAQIKRISHELGALGKEAT